MDNEMIAILEQLNELFPNHQLQVCKGFGVTPSESIKSYYYAFIEGFYWFHELPEYGKPSKGTKQSFTDMFDTLPELDKYLSEQITNYKRLLK